MDYLFFREESVGLLLAIVLGMFWFQSRREEERGIDFLFVFFFILSLSIMSMDYLSWSSLAVSLIFIGLVLTFHIFIETLKSEKQELVDKIHESYLTGFNEAEKASKSLIKNKKKRENY